MREEKGMYRFTGLAKSFIVSILVLSMILSQAVLAYDLKVIPKALAGALPGDINGDSEVNLEDVRLALKTSLALVELTEEQLKRANVDDKEGGLTNGDIDLTLVVKILKISLRLLEHTPWPEPSKEPSKPITILFIGNSMTYYGDVPSKLEWMASLYGVDIKTTMYAPGSSSLSQNKSTAIREMRKKSFDYAVFQEYWNRPLEDRLGYENDIKELCDVARETGAIPVIYNQPVGYVLDENGRQVSDKMFQSILTPIFEEVSKKNDAILVNVGDAWVYAFDKLPDVSLFLENDAHANDLGAFVIACTFAATLFDLHIKVYEWPVDPDSEIYEKRVRPYLGPTQAVWEYVSYYKANGEYPPGIVSVPPGTNEIPDYVRNNFT